jgi:hypothetical protein
MLRLHKVRCGSWSLAVIFFRNGDDFDAFTQSFCGSGLCSAVRQ